ncbi:MAG: hypothetical protein AAF449_07985 [Myxococcota bacterium]
MKSRKDLLAGNWQTVAAKEEAAKSSVYDKDDRVMYWLNLGTAQYNARQYEAAQKNFVKAEAAIKDLWTTSVSEEASKLLVSETLSEYAGEDFEKILLYYYTSLNRLEAGHLQDAIIEIRRADQFLNEIRARYDKDDELSTIYTKDAFVLWLIGLFHEIDRNYADAYLAYKEAYEVYQGNYAGLFSTPPPPFLAEDVVRTGRLSGGQSEDAYTFGQTTGATGDTAENINTMGEVIVVHAVGEAPHKVQHKFTTNSKGSIVGVALPQFKITPAITTRSMISSGNLSVETAVAEPVEHIALANFKHQLPVLKARAAARAVAKFIAIKGAQKGSEAAAEQIAGGTVGQITGFLVGLLGSAAAVEADQADLRGWTMLPANFRVARIWVPTGPQQVTATFMNNAGQTVSTKTFDVNLTAGERKILHIRTVR